MIFYLFLLFHLFSISDLDWLLNISTYSQTNWLYIRSCGNNSLCLCNIEQKYCLWITSLSVTNFEYLKKSSIDFFRIICILTIQNFNLLRFDHTCHRTNVFFDRPFVRSFVLHSANERFFPLCQSHNFHDFTCKGHHDHRPSSHTLNQVKSSHLEAQNRLK